MEKISLSLLCEYLAWVVAIETHDTIFKIFGIR